MLNPRDIAGNAEEEEMPSKRKGSVLLQVKSLCSCVICESDAEKEGRAGLYKSLVHAYGTDCKIAFVSLAKICSYLFLNWFLRFLVCYWFFLFFSIVFSVIVSFHREGVWRWFFFGFFAWLLLLFYVNSFVVVVVCYFWNVVYKIYGDSACLVDAHWKIFSIRYSCAWELMCASVFSFLYCRICW